jgi:hypothetical protein
MLKMLIIVAVFVPIEMDCQIGWDKVSDSMVSLHIMWQCLPLKSKVDCS